MRDRDLVYLVALDVREWAERLQKTNESYYYSNLCGLCGIAAGKLMVDLKAVGVESTFCFNNRHCFLLVDGHIVDVTATQFGDYPKVFIKKQEEEEKEFWDVDNQSSDLDSAIRMMQKESWVEWQQPLSKTDLDKMENFGYTEPINKTFPWSVNNADAMGQHDDEAEA